MAVVVFCFVLFCLGCLGREGGEWRRRGGEGVGMKGGGEEGGNEEGGNVGMWE